MKGSVKIGMFAFLMSIYSFVCAQESIFLPAVNYSTGGNPQSILLTSLYGKNVPDLVVACRGSQMLHVFSNNGDGNFTFTRTLGAGPSPDALAADDVNATGRNDLILARGSEKVINVYYLGASAIPDSISACGPMTNPEDVIVLDMDNDKVNEILFCNYKYSGLVSLYAHYPNGVLYKVDSFPVGGYSRYLDKADFNGDGFIDVITGNLGGNDLSLLINNQQGAFENAVSVPLGFDPAGVHVADMDRDGAMDVVVAGYSPDTLLVLKNMGNNQFSALAEVKLKSGAGHLAVNDLNGDGWPDVAVTMESLDSVYIFKNNGNGGLVYDSGYGVGDFPQDIVAVDVNGDGSKDLVVANYYNSSVSVLVNTTQPYSITDNGLNPYTFRLEQNYPNPFNPETVLPFCLQESGPVVLAVYNLTGQKIWEKDLGILPAGTYSEVFNGSGIESGVYFYSIRSGNHTQTKKMMLLK